MKLGNLSKKQAGRPGVTQQNQDRPLRPGDHVQLTIRKAESFAYMPADLVSLVESAGAVEMALLSQRVELEFQTAEVVAIPGGAIGMQTGQIYSKAEVVHLGTVRISNNGLLDLIGLAIDHLRVIDFDESKIREKLASRGV